MLLSYVKHRAVHAREFIVPYVGYECTSSFTKRKLKNVVGLFM
jgi:hypothetical protein